MRINKVCRWNGLEILMPKLIWESKIGHLEQISAKNPYGTFFFNHPVSTGGAGDRPWCRLFSIVFRTQTTHEQPHHIFAWRTHEHDTESGAHHQNHSSMVILPRNDQDNINYYQLAKQTETVGLQTFFNHCNALVGLHLNEVARSWCSHVFVFVFVIVFVMTRCRMNSKKGCHWPKYFFTRSIMPVFLTKFTTHYLDPSQIKVWPFLGPTPAPVMVKIGYMC